MAQRVFVKVFGFTGIERHALNTVFRLSEQRDIIYSLWDDQTLERYMLVLVDSQSEEAREGFDFADGTVQLIWVGASPPANVWRVFTRPLSWPDVVASMDELFTPEDVLDFDLSDYPPEPDTQPPEDAGKRALIASASLEERFYLRARLSLADLTVADEAETAAQAFEMLQAHHYGIILMDFSLPDIDGWGLLKDLSAFRPAVPHIILLKPRASIIERIRAWFHGAGACLDNPPDPGKLQRLLQKV